MTEPSMDKWNNTSGAATPTDEEGGTIRVFVASDCPLLRDGIRSALQRERKLALCGVGKTHREAIEAVSQLNPHLLVHAFSLRDPAALTLMDEVRARHPRLPVLVVALEDDPEVMGRLRCGAQAWMGRGGSTESFLAAIHRVVGVADAAGQSAQADVAGVASALKEPGVNGRRLTKREQKILELIGAGLTPREIAKALNLNVKTVESHRHNIKMKLGVETSARLAHYAFRRLNENKAD